MTKASRSAGNAALDLEADIRALAPWHLEVEVGGSVTKPTPGQDISFVKNARETFWGLLDQIYPGGLAGRSFLDCACNCGAYSFWAKERGAGDCFGFDVRDHWIRQARFLQEHRGEDIRFEQLNLYDLPSLDLDPFDVTLFKGILYHLEDPVRGLRIVAELTKETLVVNTATRNDFPDNCLVGAQEPLEHPMSGMDAVVWFPTGPETLRKMLSAVGFPSMRVNYWDREGKLGRLEVIAQRS